MKKLVALVLVALTLAAFAGSASAKARGEIVWEYGIARGAALGHTK